MKTIKVAVNEFKGVWPEISDIGYVTQIIMAKCNFDKYEQHQLTTGNEVTENEFWRVLCTKEEFNQCVDEMTSNFGSNTYRDFIEWRNEHAIEFQVNPFDISFDTDEELSPIFTPLMAGDGTCPEVGATFQVGDIVEGDSRLIDFKGREVKVIGLSKSNGNAVITFKHPTIGVGCGIHFKSWVKAIKSKGEE